MQYLTWKLSDMAFMREEGLVMVAIQASVRNSWKVTIYYMNRALLILFRKPLYVKWWDAIRTTAVNKIHTNHHDKKFYLGIWKVSPWFWFQRNLKSNWRKLKAKLGRIEEIKKGAFLSLQSHQEKLPVSQRSAKWEAAFYISAFSP